MVTRCRAPWRAVTSSAVFGSAGRLPSSHQARLSAPEHVPSRQVVK
ncbi:hypothetical protein [Streptosporangium canum]|nr:hypothetical protein [Streptosporangium canum]